MPNLKVNSTKPMTKKYGDFAYAERFVGDALGVLSTSRHSEKRVAFMGG